MIARLDPLAALRASGLRWAGGRGSDGINGA
jgi:hypothetical protein